MMLKRKAPKAKPSGFRGWLRVSGAVLVSAVIATTLAAGCLNRPVAKQEPQTSNLFVAEIRQTAVDKIDLLFMIDNSISMADKQAILAQAVPNLMLRLVTPLCVNGMGTPTSGNADANGRCANGTPEFTPIKDIHIGVVSSSLGAHGGSGVCQKPTDDDKGQLVAKVRRDPMYMFTTWNEDRGGFLAWDPDPMRARNNPRGETNANALNMNFTNMVLSVGQGGCGFEASLESWYRFLIDPEPLAAIDGPNPPTVTDVSANTQPVFNGDIAVNPVLQQRAEFLRPDSLLAIVMLSDENDCSIIDAGQGWLVGTTSINNGTFHMPRSTTACLTNPNDKCCASCAGVPAGCTPAASDPQCQMTGGTYPAQDDNTNLRCYDQKRRFGFDLLYPTQRYVDGLWEQMIPNRSGTLVPNPIYAGTPPRDRSLVFLAGIVGVPWQDVAVPETIAPGMPLKLLTYQGMVEQRRWEMILGSNDGINPPGVPGDKLMFETPVDRTTIGNWGQENHPVTEVGQQGRLQPSNATGQPNVINGHESTIADNSDLQYACIFKLPTAVDCGAGAAACDCKATDAAFNRPLCNGTTQTHAKAYPGIRELQVLKDYGVKGTQNSIVASICPKSTTQGDPSYGYGPAVSAIVDRLKEALRGKCLPRRLVAEKDPGAQDFGQVPCAVVEATPAMNGACGACEVLDRPGRAEADNELKVAVYSQLANASYCGNQNQPGCESSYCLCKINQFSAGELARCQTEATAPADIFGYCYVDPDTVMAGDSRKQAMESIVASCPASQKRLLRFAGENVPAKGSIAMIACLGATIRDEPQAAPEP